MSTGYAIAYRLGLRPWERAGQQAQATFDVLLDREEQERARPLGRALDVGCGRGQHTHKLARRGWDATGVDNIPRALDAARSAAINGIDSGGASFVEGDVTRLSREVLGCFDFFLDVGCLHGLDRERRTAEGQGISRLAEPGATMLLLAFLPHSLPFLPKGITPNDVMAAFPNWQITSTEAADTTGMPGPLKKTAPQWYRLRYTH